MLRKLGIDGVDVLLRRAELVHLGDVLVICDEFFEKDADVLGDDGVELLDVLVCYLLIVLDDPV